MMNFQQYKELCRSASLHLGLEDPDMLASQGYMGERWCQTCPFL